MANQIEILQGEIAEWAKRNFGDPPAWECLLGLQEELGELSHAWLKRHQGIRLNEDHEAGIKDAVGDIFIYLSDFCRRERISLSDCVEKTWASVKQRDWNKHREEHQERGN